MLWNTAQFGLLAYILLVSTAAVVSTGLSFAVGHALSCSITRFLFAFISATDIVIMADSLMASEKELLEVFGNCLPSLMAAGIQEMDADDQGHVNKRKKPDGTTQPSGRRFQPRSQDKPVPSSISSKDLGQLVYLMAKIMLLQDAKLQMLRVEKQFVILMETGPQRMIRPLFAVAQKWKAARDASPPTTNKSLRVALVQCYIAEFYNRLVKLMQHPETKANMIKHRYVAEQDDKILCIHGMESRGAGAADGHHEAGYRAPRDGGDGESVEDARTAGQGCGDPQVSLGKAHGGANLPFLLSIGLRGEDCSQAYQCCQKWCGNTVLKLVGCRMKQERLQRHQMVQALARAIESKKNNSN